MDSTCSPEAEVASPPALALGAAGTLRWAIPRPPNVHNASRASFAEGCMDDDGPFFEDCPVFHGDTLYSEARVTEVRESRSRPGFGLVRIRTRGLNERGEAVVEFDRVFMVRKRGETWHGARAE